jgi:hypothetical protein
MIPQSYLILSPASPTDLSKSALAQRQSIPLAWAFAVSSAEAELKSVDGQHYFQTRIGDALAVLDRGMAGWSYNRYLRDTLAPIGVFRAWLANHPSDTWLYLNFTELLSRSPDPATDLAELSRLHEKVLIAFEEIEAKNFTQFISELRKLSYPMITVPITGDRKVDTEILSFEVRDTSSIEAEMALQMIGTDPENSILSEAVASVHLKREDSPGADGNWSDPALELARELTLFSHDYDGARALFVDRMGCTVQRDGRDHIILKSGEVEFMLVRIAENPG